MQLEDSDHELTRYKAYLVSQWHAVTRHKIVALVVIVTIGTYAILQFSNEAMTFRENVKRTFDSPRDTKRPEQAEEKENQNCRECDAIYQTALEDVDNYRLTSPSGDNAYEKYLELKKLEYHLSERVLEKIVGSYEVLIKANVSQGKVGAAKVFLGRLKTVDGSRNYREWEEAIDEAEKGTRTAVADKVTNQGKSPDHAQVPDEDQNGEAGKHVSLEWIGGVCLAMGSALADTTKIDILESSLKEIDVLAARDLYELFSCARLLGDTSKLNAVRNMAYKVTTQDLTQKEFGSIIRSFLGDTSKSKATAILVPLLKKH